MKLAYNNWHKEIVHDDAIQSELTSITDGQLTFTNTPFVKAYSPHRICVTGIEVVIGKPRGGKFQQRGGSNGGEAEDVIIGAEEVVATRKKILISE
jgi:hypothetical protein